MRILFITSISSWGGGEVWLMDMLHGLRARGHAVFLLCRGGSPVADRAQAGGFAVFPIRIGGDLDPLVIARSRRLMIANRIEVVCTNTDKDLRFGGLAARLAGIRAVVASREVDFPLKDSWPYRFAYNSLASAIAVNSRATRDTLLSSAPWLDPSRLRVVYKGVDATPHTAATLSFLTEWGIPEGDPTVCFVGRLDEQKGLIYLLEAWKLLHAIIPHARLLLVGEGKLRPFIEEFVAHHGLQKNIILAGFRNDVRLLLSSCAVLVLPSLWEGFGYAAVEAMAEGVPVVASAASSLPEVVEDGKTGLLFPPRDSAALADALVRLLRDPGLARRMGHEGALRVRKLFTIETMLDGFEALFAEQLAPSRT
jgi:glycosyltransferase involved in cell wall biosynthesis